MVKLTSSVALVAALADLVENGQYHDVEIFCMDGIVRTNSAFLAAASPWWKSILSLERSIILPDEVCKSVQCYIRAVLHWNQISPGWCRKLFRIDSKGQVKEIQSFIGHKVPENVLEAQDESIPIKAFVNKTKKRNQSKPGPKLLAKKAKVDPDRAEESLMDVEQDVKDEPDEPDMEAFDHHYIVDPEDIPLRPPKGDQPLEEPANRAEKTYPCSFCPKEFSSTSKKRRHEKIHLRKKT